MSKNIILYVCLILALTGTISCFKKKSLCDVNCKKITNEFELLQCLDSCAANNKEIVEAPIRKIVILSIVVVIGFVFTTNLLTKLFIEKDKKLIARYTNMYYKLKSLISKDTDYNPKYDISSCYIKLN